MLNQFNEGGLHSENPLGGIPMGSDSNGVPNTVEQGETMKDDFVYSDRIILTSDVINQFNLPKSLSGKTVAEATKLIDKKFDGRNDRVSKSTQKSLLDRTAQAQENIKAKQDQLAYAQQLNSEEVPDMMNGEVPQGMEQFTPQQPMANGGYLGLRQNKMFLGGDSYNSLNKPSVDLNNISESNTTQGQNPMGGMMGNTGGGMSGGAMGAIGVGLGAIGTGLSSMKKQNEFYDPINAKKDQTQGMVSKTKDTVASAIGPWGQLFRGIEKAGQGAGDAIGGDTGNYVSAAFSPDEAMMRANQDPDIKTSDKVLGMLLPFHAAKMARKAEQNRQQEFRRNQASRQINAWNNDFALGGGLERGEDYGSNKKPYPSVDSGDFAGGGRSYPIPTKADAIDALRLAGLHGRSDIRSKVFAKYPSLQHADGGFLGDGDPVKGDPKKKPTTQEGSHVITNATSEDINRTKQFYKDQNFKEVIDPVTGKTTFVKEPPSRFGKITGVQKGVQTDKGSGTYFYGPEFPQGRDFVLSSSPSHDQLFNSPQYKEYLAGLEAQNKPFLDAGMQPLSNTTIDKSNRLTPEMIDAFKAKQIKMSEPIAQPVQFGYGGKMKRYVNGGPLNKDEYVKDFFPYGKFQAPTTSEGTIDNQVLTSDLVNQFNNKNQPNWYDNNKPFFTTDQANPKKVDFSGVGKTAKKGVNWLGENYGNILRYAPIAMNAYQLSKLSKPEIERLQRLNTRFKPEYVDEASLQNIAGNEMDNTIAAITQIGGSPGATRNAILAAGLNKNKALSDAMINAEAQNRATNLQGQQFNLGIDQANISQSNLEKDINAKNIGAYQTEKSRLLGQIGNDLGNVGKEEVYKQMAKNMYGYKWNGKYYTGPDGDKKTPAEMKVMVDEQAQNQQALGGYLFNKKGKKKYGY